MDGSVGVQLPRAFDGRTLGRTHRARPFRVRPPHREIALRASLHKQIVISHRQTPFASTLHVGGSAGLMGWHGDSDQQTIGYSCCYRRNMIAIHQTGKLALMASFKMPRPLSWFLRGEYDLAFTYWKCGVLGNGLILGGLGPFIVALFSDGSITAVNYYAVIYHVTTALTMLAIWNSARKYEGELIWKLLAMWGAAGVTVIILFDMVQAVSTQSLKPFATSRLIFHPF
jgi:hypothetical protein